MIRQLRGGHVSQEPRPGQPAFDRLMRLVGDGDVGLAIALGAGPAVAVLASVFDAGVLEDHEVGRHVFQLLGDLLGDPAALFSAACAGPLTFFQVVFDADAGQMIGKLAAAVGLALGRDGNTDRRRGLREGNPARRDGLDRRNPQAEQQQLPRVEPLGPRAVAGPQQHPQAVLEQGVVFPQEGQVLPQRLQRAVAFGQIGALTGDDPLEGLGVVGKLEVRIVHDAGRLYPRSRTL